MIVSLVIGSLGTQPQKNHLAPPPVWPVTWSVFGACAHRRSAVIRVFGFDASRCTAFRPPLAGSRGPVREVSRG